MALPVRDRTHRFFPVNRVATAGDSKRRQANVQTHSGADSFETLLGRLINTHPTKTDGLDPLTIQRLVEWIQLEMNTLLFTAVGSDRGAKGFVEMPNGLGLSHCERPSGKNPDGRGRNVGGNRCVAGRVPGGDDTDSIIKSASDRYHVDPHLIRAVIGAESNFDSTAESAKGAQGLMQLMPETARELGVADAYDPTENIMGGTRYLKVLLDRYDGNVPLALAAYNWGMGNVERNPGRLPEETRIYIARVNAYYQEGAGSAS